MYTRLFSRIRIPDFPGVSGLEEVWAGTGADAGTICFPGASPIVAEEPVYSLSVVYHIWRDETEAARGYETTAMLSPKYSSMNGWGWFCHDYRNEHFRIHFVPTLSAWVFSEKPAGITPSEYTITSASRRYEEGEIVWSLSSVSAGDEFFSGDIPEVGTSAEWTPRGSLANESVSALLVVSASWKRWERGTPGASGLAGVYDIPLDGATGSHVVGLPSWGSEGDVVRSLYEDDTGHFEYGDAKWLSLSACYLSGQVGSPLGWYLAEEPSAGCPWTLSGWALDASGTPVSSGTATLPWNDYTMDEELHDGNHFVGEVSLCH